MRPSRLRGPGWQGDRLGVMMNIQPRSRHRHDAGAAQKLWVQEERPKATRPIDPRSNDAYGTFGHAAKTKALKVTIEARGPAGGEHGVGNFRIYRGAEVARYAALHPQPRGLMSASSDLDCPISVRLKRRVEGHVHCFGKTPFCD